MILGTAARMLRPRGALRALLAGACIAASIVLPRGHVHSYEADPSFSPAPDAARPLGAAGLACDPEFGLPVALGPADRDSAPAAPDDDASPTSSRDCALCASGTVCGPAIGATSPVASAVVDRVRLSPTDLAPLSAAVRAPSQARAPPTA